MLFTLASLSDQLVEAEVCVSHDNFKNEKIT